MKIDKELVKRRFERSIESYDRSAVVQLRLCGELANTLARWRVGSAGQSGGLSNAGQSGESIGEHRRVKRALELGTGTGALTRELLALYPEAEWYLNDIVEQSQNYVSTFTHGHSTTFIFGDAEQITLPDRLDLIASSSTIQWFFDIPKFLDRTYKALNSGGLLALSSFGERNFEQIRTITDRSLCYYTLEELVGLVQRAGYRILESHQSLEQLHLPTPLDVLRHIRSTGANGIISEPWSGATLAEFERKYCARYSTPSGVSLSYHPIVVIAERL